MKILITGIAGLLGSRLADYIIKNHSDVEIVGIDDLSGGYFENINPKVEFWKMNLVNCNLDKCFSEHKFDYVYHFAAYAAEGLSPFIRSFNYQNNLVATSRIINECIKHDVKRLVFTSTLAVYGHGNGGVFDEGQTPKPIDPYGVAKYGCEMDIQIAGEQHGLDWCIIRPHNVYGVKQNIWDKYRNVLGIWMFQYMNDEPNSGNVIHKESRHEVKNSIPTFQKSIDLLDFKHETSLKEGLTKMWEWVQKQPKRDRFVWSEYELEKGIYSFWKNKTTI